MNDASSELLAADDVLNPETYRPLYPKALLDDLAKELSIESEEARSRFEDTVLFAAGVYKASKNSLKRKAPRYRETEALKKIAKKAAELNEAILKTRQTGMAYFRLVTCGMPAAKANAMPFSSSAFREVLQVLVRGDARHMSIPGHVLEEAVRFLRNAADTAAADEAGVLTTHKNFAVEQWLRTLGQIWTEFTDLPFTVGRYHVKAGYENKTLYVLQQLMKSLDGVTTRKQIESALRQVTKENRQTLGESQAKANA